MVAQQKPRVAKNIEELMRDVDETLANEPGDAPGTVIAEPSKEFGAGMMLGKPESAGYVSIWDTVTGVQSIVNRNMVRILMTRKRPDGSHVFTTAKPDFEPFKGNLLCMLHPDHPQRSEYAELGLQPCRKATLPTQQDVRLHMMHRHKREWEAIETKRKNETEAEERELRRLTIHNLRGAAPTVAAPAKVTVAPVNETVAEPITVKSKIMIGEYSAACETCGEMMTAKGRGGWNMKKFHHDKKHPKVA